MYTSVQLSAKHNMSRAMCYDVAHFFWLLVSRLYPWYYRTLVYCCEQNKPRRTAWHNLPSHICETDLSSVFDMPTQLWGVARLLAVSCWPTTRGNVTLATYTLLSLCPFFSLPPSLRVFRQHNAHSEWNVDAVQLLFVSCPHPPIFIHTNALAFTLTRTASSYPP